MKIKEQISDIGKGMKDTINDAKDKAVQVIDRNGDGKIDLEDVSVVADKATDKVKDGVQDFVDIANDGIDSLVNAANEIALNQLLKKLKPIFLEDLNGETISRFIRIVKREKKYEKIDNREPIGYLSEVKKITYMNIFRDSVDKIGLTFYPNKESEFYYVNPTDKDNYIVLDEYFNYLKQVRIGELQKIAQDLGAKHFRVTYKREKILSTNLSANAVGKGGFSKFKGHGKVDHRSQKKQYDKIEIAAEMDCPGHAPVMPNIKYMKYDPTIQGLIEMRMSQNPVKHQVLTLQLSNSCGIKLNDAANIDAILNNLNMKNDAHVEYETKNEIKSILEYEVDF